MNARRTRRLVARVALLPLGSMACTPEIERDDGLVTEPRLLAVQQEPPETKPGAAATYRAFVADPHGTADASSIRFRFCLAPKELAEDNVVSEACLDDAWLSLAGTGPSVVAASPDGGCALFGPDTPADGARPRDPDETGGYYQPLRVDVPGAVPAFHLGRLSCGLGAAPADAVRAFASAYLPNRNPRLTALSAMLHGSKVTLDHVPPGATLELRVSWPSEDAESYAYFEPRSQTVVTRREALRVAWLASAGSLATESTGRAEADFSAESRNTWTAPPEPGAALLWVVLRDSRGGSDVRSVAVAITR